MHAGWGRGGLKKIAIIIKNNNKNEKNQLNIYFNNDTTIYPNFSINTSFSQLMKKKKN